MGFGDGGGAAGLAMALVPRVRQMERKVRSCILPLDVSFEAIRVG